MNSYLNMYYKYAKLNTECFLMLLGCDTTTEEKELNKMLEMKCPSILPTDNLK